MQKSWQNFLQSHLATHSSSAECNANLWDLMDSYGLLKITGPQAKRLLQGQLTCDVEKLTHLSSCMGALCQSNGRIISLFYLFQFANDYYLLLPHNMIAITLSALKKYAAFYKVELNEASNDFILLGYQGEYFRSNDEAIISIPMAPHHSQQIIVGRYTEMQSLLNDLTQHASFLSSNAWRSRMIDANIPMIYPQTSGKLLPHEINLQQLNALSFEKGCYTGQEIIARMHYLGKLKNHLYCTRISYQTTLLPGTLIYAKINENTKVSGMIVDACHDQESQQSVLIVTDKENAKNNHLFVEQDKNFFIFEKKNEK